MGGRCCGWCSAYRGCEAVVTGQIHYAWLDDVWLERRQGFLFHVWGVAFGKSTVCQRAHAEPPSPPVCGLLVARSTV